MGLLEQLTTALGDRYRVERELGRGGMAVVFLAEDLKHHRPVAIKLLKPELSAVLGSERFLREIEIAAALQHPHILPLYDSGEAAGLLYYVMPFAEGESLRQRLAREPQLPLDAALRITREVGSALQYAHEHGVVHRDIKPENIMLSGGQAVVADFGIARALHAVNADQLTQSGMVVGTPQYMSPEQSGGGAADGRSDQYSLACTLYEMLIGQPPFTGPTTQAVMARHSLEPVPSLRIVRQTVPEAVEQAIMRAMAKLPADRFASMQRFLDALESPDVTRGQATVPVPARSVPAPRMARRALTALGAGALVAAAAWFVARRTVTGAPVGGSTVTALAVLPFQERSSNPDSAYLGGGMTEGLIADLAQIGSLKVISGSSGSLAQEAGRSLAEIGKRAGRRRRRARVDTEGRRQRPGERAIPPRPGQYRHLRAGLSGSSGRAAGPPAGDHHRPSPARSARISRTPSGAASSRATRWINGPTRPTCVAASISIAASSSRHGLSSSKRAESRPRGRRPTSAWPTTTRRCRSSPTFRRRRCCPRPGRRWPAPSSSTRRWRKRTRPTPTSGPTTSGTGAPPSRSSGAPSSCGRATPTPTSPTAAFSRHAAGWTRPSPSSAGPWSWIRSRSRCWRTARCSTTSRAATTRRAAGCGRSSRATPPT